MKYYCPPVPPRTIYILNLLQCKDYGENPKSYEKCSGCSMLRQCTNLAQKRSKSLIKSERIR